LKHSYKKYLLILPVAVQMRLGIFIKFSRGVKHYRTENCSKPINT